MAVKKTLCLAAALAISLGILWVRAEEEPGGLRLEQVHIVMPELEAYVHLTGGAASASPAVEALLDNRPLAVEGVADYDPATHGTLYTFLVDVSTSIRTVQMQAVRESLKAFAAGLGERDRLMLLSFGERITVLLDGSEERSAAGDQIDRLANNEDKTRLYDAIGKTVELSDGHPDSFPRRQVAVVISDGVDYNEGGFTQAEILGRLRDGGLPLYAFGFSHGSKAALDAFGALSRESGGGMRVVSDRTLGGQLAEAKREIESCKVLSLRSESNLVGGSRELTIRVSAGGRLYEKTVAVTPKLWIKDTAPPTVTEARQEGENGVRLTFSEAVTGAQQLDHYVITGPSGTRPVIQSVRYVEDAGYYVELTLAGRLYAGTYAIGFTGIADRSMEAHPLQGEATLRLEGTPVALLYLKIVFTDFWWALLIAALALAGLIAYLVLRRRRGLVTVDGKVGFGDGVEIKRRFSVPDTARLRLVVTGPSGAAQPLDIDVAHSVFVGRADINNLVFDDPKLSRQHFVIEHENGAFYISDLQTTNGTFVNGVPLRARRRLNDGDVVEAGNERFVYRDAGLKYDDGT